MFSQLNSRRLWEILLLVTILAAENTQGTLSQSDKKSKKSKGVKKAEPATTNVLRRGLVKETMKAAEILREHMNYCELEREVRHFKGAVLGYVTPWNGHGYDIAKLFHKKFTMLSPVWLQVKVKQGKYIMSGGHDVDKDWVQEVTRAGKNSVVPRVLFDGWSSHDFEIMFQSEETMMKCAKVITQYIKKNKFHGLTLELWSQVDPSRHQDAIHFLIHLADLLHQHRKIIVLVVPPTNARNGQAPFSKHHFEQLKDSVDYFNVMTYDYHHQAQQAAPISPLQWVKQSIENIAPVPSSDRAKLLLGIHFYGVKFTGEYSLGQPIIGTEFIDTLIQYSPLVKWQPEDAEHSIHYDDERGNRVFTFYPSLYFLEKRLNLAAELGTGVAIWELGQGLDYFYDLL